MNVQRGHSRCGVAEGGGGGGGEGAGAGAVAVAAVADELDASLEVAASVVAPVSSGSSVRANMPSLSKSLSGLLLTYSPCAMIAQQRALTNDDNVAASAIDSCTVAFTTSLIFRDETDESICDNLRIRRCKEFARPCREI
jgi:hypothetical protein